VADDFTERYGDLLTGSCDCADRIVLNAYYPMGSTAGGFRTWWRRLVGGSDAEADAVLDNTHLMRLAGRFARRVRAWAADNAVPVIDCPAGERKHLIAEEYLRTHSVGPGVFLILVAKAPAMIWDVRRPADGTVISNLARKRTYVNHYSFHMMDRAWGHLVVKMAGHAPFAAQVILNGPEYVAIAAQGEGIGFTKEGNCFTEITDPDGLAQLTLRDHVIAPILAGVKIRRHDHVPARLTPIDQDYEHLRTDMATLFRHLGIQPGPAAA